MWTYAGAESRSIVALEYRLESELKDIALACVPMSKHYSVQGKMTMPCAQGPSQPDSFSRDTVVLHMASMA